MTRFALIGPTHPYRGGIAHYTTLLAQALRQEQETLLISFSRQYPRWLFPGRSDRDPSRRPLQTEAEYLLEPLNPISWGRTLRRNDQRQADIVVIPWWVPFWAPAWAMLGRGIKRLPQPPRLLFICHNVLPHEKSLLDKAALRLALAPGDGFIVHAQADGRRLREQFPEAKIRVSPLPTYAALGQGLTSLPVDLPSDRPLLLFFGFVRHYKGLDVLLQALPLFLAKRPVYFLVVGEFWEDEAGYRSQIKRLQLESAVTIVNDYVPDEALAAYVKAATVVVLPYRSATQSAVVQVAFGQGRPVITTDVGGLAEVVADGRTGLIVPPEDPEALARAINQFFDQELGPEFEENIQQEKERFSWQKLIHTLTQLQDK
jgi:glycosyltransferase involved in cell wall biosynthesis